MKTRTLNRFNNILDYYNNLVITNSYKGLNLLEDSTLNIKFSQKTSSLEIKGQDIRYEKLGINKSEWKTVEDIEKSLSEIQSGLTKVNTIRAEFSSYTSIVSERDNFMSSLSNILTEGADKLLLADINEESANLLALGSREKLAVNSLSLASQSSRSILRLF